MLSLARNDVSLPSKDDELLDYDELIRGIDEQLLAIDALPLPSPSPAAAVPFSVLPPPLPANAATSPARERQEPSDGLHPPPVGTNIQVGNAPSSTSSTVKCMPGGLGISVGPTESAAAGEPPLFEQLEAAAAPGWVVAATPELSGWEAPSGAESIDVDATSSVRKRQEPALANAVAFQQLESPRGDSSSSAGASRADMELGHARQRPPPQPPPPQRVCLTARL